MIVGPELELCLITARKTVVTAVRAAAVRVQRPVERHAFHRVQRGAARHFLIPRGVCSPLCLIQCRVAALTDLEGDRPCRWRPLPQIKYQRLLRHLWSFVFYSPLCQGAVSSR